MSRLAVVPPRTEETNKLDKNVNHLRPWFLKRLVPIQPLIDPAVSP